MTTRQNADGLENQAFLVGLQGKPGSFDTPQPQPAKQRSPTAQASVFFRFFLKYQQKEASPVSRASL
jgi:hypothetical protein